jgi:hypothetical protein
MLRNIYLIVTHLLTQKKIKFFKVVVFQFRPEGNQNSVLEMIVKCYRICYQPHCREFLEADKEL